MLFYLKQKLANLIKNKNILPEQYAKWVSSNIRLPPTLWDSFRAENLSYMMNYFKLE